MRRRGSHPLRRPLLLFLPAIVLLPGAPAFAWSGAMNERVAQEAARLMPSALQSILKRHALELAAGARAACGPEESAAHTFDPGQPEPSAASRLAALTDEAVALIDAHAPFARLAEKLGAIAHVVGDLNNPLQVAEHDPREPDYGTKYLDYVGRSLPRYKLVFYGWEDPVTRAARSLPGEAREAILGLARRSAARARAQYAPIAHAYDPANRTPMAKRFDVRSLPFGIGSLGWSHSVSDTARVWLHVWRRARGDVRGTPFLTAALLTSDPAIREGSK